MGRSASNYLPGVALFVGLFACTFHLAKAEIIGELSDHEQLDQMEYVDILSAWIEQDGGMLTFVIETRGPIPTTLTNPDDHLTFIWLVDADNDVNTGQPHGQTGTEFNVRAVISELYGGGFVDVTGSLPGGGTGTVVIQDNRVQVTIGLNQIANPSSFRWQSDACHAVNNMCISANYETIATNATPLPYAPPALVTITTPLLMLCPNGPATGQIQTELRDVGGNVLDNTGYHFAYHSSNEAVATVDANGTVTARAVPITFGDTPVIEVKVDGVAAGSVAVIRVTNTNLGVVHRTYAGSNIAFYLPAEIEGVNLDALTIDYQVVLATDLAYVAQRELTGVTPFGGGTQWFVLDISNETVTLPCGLSGNPVRLGWEFGKPVHNSCYIVNWPGDRVPQFGVIFHEMGHNMTWPSWGFGQFCSTGSPHDWKYSEALASMAGAWSWYTLQRCQQGLEPLVIDTIARSFPNINPDERHALAEYLADGSHYDDISVDVICDILWNLYDDYGPRVWFDLFSTFVPIDDPLPVVLDSAAKQATWIVAAVSVTAGEDLRDRFAGEYGFPIDNAAWADILVAVQARIAARPWREWARPDFDCDRDVDMHDLDLFVECASGPALPIASTCERKDFDHDFDVDTDDFAVFQRCFSGEGGSADPACAD